MSRRAITRADEGLAQGLLSKAFATAGIRTVGGGPPGLHWDATGQLFAIDGRRWDGIGAEWQRMGAATATVGIHPGANGWEIEDAVPVVKVGDLFRSPRTLRTFRALKCEENGAWHLCNVDDEKDYLWVGRDVLLDTTNWLREEPAAKASPARPPLPAGFGWFERGVDSYSLDGPDGKPIARARASTVMPGTGVWQIGDGPWWPVDSLSAAKDAAEDACRSAGLLDFIHARVARALGVNVERVIVTSDNASSTIERVEVDGVEVGEGALDVLRAAGLKVRPKVEADPAFPSDGGVERETANGSAAQAFSRALLFVAGFDETGFPRQSAGSATEYLAYLDGLAKTFVRELRREVAPAEQARGVGDAAGAFVGSRFTPDLAWWQGQAAAAIEEARLANARAEAAERGQNAALAEARVADENAKELAADLGKLRARVDVLKSQREFQKGRADENEAQLNEARQDLRTIRADVIADAHALAARMGAPHG